MADVPNGVQALKEQYAREAEIGMIGNLGARIVDVGAGTLVIEADLSDSRHGFPSGRGPIVHGGAIATLADEAWPRSPSRWPKMARPPRHRTCRSTTTARPRRAGSSRAPLCAIARADLRTARPPSSRRTAS